MASNTFCVGNMRYRRATKQGRNPAGLGRPYVQRLFEEDETAMAKAKELLGIYYNKNDFVRTAVKFYIRNVYTELLNT